MRQKIVKAEACGAALLSARGKLPKGYIDPLFRGITRLFAAGIVVLFAAMLVVLWIESRPALEAFGFGFLTSTAWNPVTQQFGAVIAIVGTLVSTLIAMVIAIPISIGIAIYLSEIAPHWLRAPVGIAIELLAAIPSIVFGMWGLFVIAPIMANTIQPALQKELGFLPFFTGPTMGIGMLTAGVILALMIIPFISSVSRDVFMMTPQPLKEAAYGLGGTTWEVVRDVVIPYGKKGVFGAVFLGLGRALGETMAVTFVIGNAYHLSLSLFAPGNSIASILANEFTEADSKVYMGSLIELSLVLFVITFVILGAAQLWLRSRSGRGARQG